MKRYIKHLMKGAEIRTDNFLRSQDKNPESIQYGGMHGDVAEAKTTIYHMATALSVYFKEDSRFYRNEALFDAINLACGFVRRMQRENGSFDYPTCNFQSAADTSFCFKRLILGYRLLDKYGTGGDKTEVLKRKYLVIMQDALKAIRDGGFHTPNHRWGITAALLQGANLFAEDEAFADSLRKRAAQYLAEGVDEDEDGEYAERSTGNYNAVVNNAMFAIGQETGEELYYDYARKNLKMMLLYIDPDDTIFTQNSSRQDKGRAEYADKYFYQYLYAACLGDDGVFDGAAHKIVKDNMERGDIAPDCFPVIMTHDEMMKHEFTEYGFAESYRKYFRHSGVLRVKKEEYTYTVLNGKSSFLFFKTGSTAVCVKIGESCCEKRNFVPKTMEVNEQGCVLSEAFDSWYYLPFDEPQNTSDWWEMDQTKRKKLLPERLNTRLEIRELPEGLELHLKADGLKGLPLRLEICIPAGTTVENEHFYMKAEAGSGMILRDGCLQVKDSDRELVMGPGFGSHEFKGHYSGEEVNDSGFTVYCNEYTPLEKVFKICVKHS